MVAVSPVTLGRCRPPSNVASYAGAKPWPDRRTPTKRCFTSSEAGDLAHKHLVIWLVVALSWKICANQPTNKLLILGKINMYKTTNLLMDFWSLPNLDLFSCFGWRRLHSHPAKLVERSQSYCILVLKTIFQKSFLQAWWISGVEISRLSWLQAKRMSVESDCSSWRSCQANEKVVYWIAWKFSECTWSCTLDPSDSSGVPYFSDETADSCWMPFLL